jgi:hypothetical protein
VSESAGKKKKAKKEAPSGGSTKAGRVTYTVPIKDFAVLAQYVADQGDPPVQVPLKFGGLLDRAIAMREWYSAAISPHILADVHKQKSDDRHAFFLGVLKNVRDILTPRYAKNYTPKRRTPKSIDDIQAMFANLEVEEPSEALQEATTATPAKSQTEASDVHYQAERLEGVREDFLAFHLLLSDLSKLRAEVERTWEAYQQGLLDLVTVSITTNTAVDLARSLEEEYKDLFARRGGVDHMLASFYHAQCAAANTTEDHKERFGDDMNMKMYKTADAIFWIPFVLISSFLDVVEPGYLPEIRKGHFGIRDATSNRSKKTTREKLNEDKILIMEMLPEFLVLTIGVEQSPAEDEMTRLLRTTFKTKQVTLSLSFAVQLYLDIHNKLRNEVGQAFSQLANIASFARNNIKNTLDFHKDLRVDNWPKQNDDHMAAFSDEITHWILGDPHRTAAKQLRRKNIPAPYFFFQQHPWLCGLWKYYIQTQLQTLGVAFANAWGSIMSCAHLYNAVQREKLLTHQWPDMTLAFTLHTEKSFFIGSPPTTTEDYLKRFILALGGSVTNFGPGDKGRKKNKNKPVLSSRGPNALKELAPVLATFRERYCEKTPRLDLRAQDVQLILDKSEWQWEFDDEGNPATLVKDSEVVKGYSKPLSTKQVTMTRLISLLRAGIQAEILEFSFDYLTFHRFCWRLLRSVKDSCRDQLIRMYGPDYIEKENQLPFVVGYILATATNTKLLAESMRVKLTDEVTSAVLKCAADELEGMVMTGAGEMVGTVLRETLGVPFEFQEDDSDEE